MGGRWCGKGGIAHGLAVIAGLAIAAQTMAQSGSHRGPGHGGGGLFISPMGEPFRGAEGMAQWFKGADRDGDGRLSPAECTADAARFFATLDVNGDGEIDPDELTRYETDIAPEVQSGSAGGPMRGEGHGRGGRSGGGSHGHGGGGGGGGRHGGGMGSGGPDGGPSSSPGAGSLRPEGAARFGLLGLPEPVIAADTDFNRGVSRLEFRDAAIQRCHLLDRDGDGLVGWGELPTTGSVERSRRASSAGDPS